MKIYLFIGAVLFSLTTYGQNPGKTRLFSEMDQAVDLMEHGHYEEADEKFQYVMRNLESLPSELAYYFGRNSFHLEKYKQSINWLNKYIQLKGTSGRFYEQASKYLHLAEENYLNAISKEREAFKEGLASSEYDCGGLDKMICPVCRGEGVIIKKGPFEPIYQTCPYSAGKPYLTCEEYNLFMKGELSPKL